MCEERHWRTGRPNSFLDCRGKRADNRVAGWESDQLIVLGERENCSQWEGADVIRSIKPTERQPSDHRARVANLTVGNSEQGKE